MVSIPGGIRTNKTTTRPILRARESNQDLLDTLEFRADTLAARRSSTTDDVEVSSSDHLTLGLEPFSHSPSFYA
jgi:hypothetical protein